MKVDAWWPRGYGEAKLYDLEVIFTPDGYSTDAAASSTLRTGFRTIELVEDPVESGELLFQRTCTNLTIATYIYNTVKCNTIQRAL